MFYLERKERKKSAGYDIDDRLGSQLHREIFKRKVRKGKVWKAVEN